MDGLSLLSEKAFDQLLFCHLQILRNISKNPLNCSELDWIVVWNRDEMLSPCVCAS